MHAPSSHLNGDRFWSARRMWRSEFSLRSLTYEGPARARQDVDAPRDTAAPRHDEVVDARVEALGVADVDLRRVRQVVGLAVVALAFRRLSRLEGRQHLGGHEYVRLMREPDVRPRGAGRHPRTSHTAHRFGMDTRPTHFPDRSPRRRCLQTCMGCRRRMGPSAQSACTLRQVGSHPRCRGCRRHSLSTLSQPRRPRKSSWTPGCKAQSRHTVRRRAGRAWCTRHLRRP